MQYPQLARSYHSMVGWGDGTVAAFGGFQQDSNIPGEVRELLRLRCYILNSNEFDWWHGAQKMRQGLSVS